MINFKVCFSGVLLKIRKRVRCLKSKKIMKKIVFFTCLSLIAISCEKEVLISKNELPPEITAYITTHFPENEIIQVIKEKDGLELTYDIMLEGGYFLEFDRKKEIKDIEGTFKLPDSVIPSALLNYVLAYYADNFIVIWEIDDKNQQITLDNGLELVFTMSGNHIRIDN